MSRNSSKGGGTTPGKGGKGGRQSPRERMREERAAAARRDKIRRQFMVGGSVVLVLAIAAGIGIAVSGGDGGGKPDGTAASGPLVVPANTSGSDGTVIPYGDAKAKNTLKIYEDMRCPYCAQFEQTDGDMVLKLADEGRYKVEYHFATFLDDALGGGNGSKNALAALGAAVNESTDKFVAYHRVLFANHPDERDDAYASPSHLLDLAGKVPGLRNPEFDKAVKDLTYLPWVKKVTAEFEKSGVTGTPAVMLNDKKLEVLSGRGAVPPRQFTDLVDKQLGTG